MGVIPGFRKQGIEAVFYAKTIQYAQKNKLIGGEASLILENNDMMNQALKNLGAFVYKTYRVYKLNV